MRNAKRIFALAAVLILLFMMAFPVVGAAEKPDTVAAGESEQSEVTDDERIFGYTDYAYDGAGRLTKADTYEEDPEKPSETVQYEYDEDGRLLKESLLDESGDVGTYYVYEYNPDGLLIKRNCYEDDTLVSWTEYKYDKNGNFIREIHYSNEPEETGSVWALLPPIIAIALALITKEVYSSLFIGIIAGGLIYAVPGSGNPIAAFKGTLTHIFEDGVISVLSDSYNMGILVFLVILGTMVCLMNSAGGSAAFGRWASKNIKTRVGAQLASVVLGVLIFIDDYFNCLTVGSVMRPLTDKHLVSRAKLAYIIDATAAPICIIAPVSSWAAAVASYADDGQGLMLFIRSIPYNFYALFTIVMMVGMILMKVDFGPMARFERNALKTGDLFSGSNPYKTTLDDDQEKRGTVIDLVLPIIVLIISCIVGMIYSGGFFDSGADGYMNVITAFSNSDASVGLMLGSAVALVLTIIFYLCRRVLPFRKMMECLPEGFKAMVPAILILTFAWTLKAMTDALGAKEFVAGVVNSSAGAMQVFLPAIVFLVGCLLAFATGTSWGTFGILIPITLSVFPADNPLSIICVAACMAGAVCGDHCSPISDTTIMASAGAQCDHVNHVSTQLPYAIAAAAISFVCYMAAGLLASLGVPALVMLPVGIVLTIGFLVVMKKRQKN